eukprot:gene15971-21675_t
MSSSSCSMAIVGDGSVGKSTIVNAFRTEGFLPVYKQTIGIDFYEKQLKIRGDVTVSLRVWDIGGQSIHSKNLSTYLQAANALLLVYDVTNDESFRNLDDWLIQIQKYINLETCSLYLIGNKIDLIALRQITVQQHEKYILDNNLKGGLFVSARTGENVVKTFYKISAELIGMKLTEHELGFYDKVLTTHIDHSERDEIRNTWADDIEKEDMELERKKANGSVCSCTCS